MAVGRQAHDRPRPSPLRPNNAGDPHEHCDTAATDDVRRSAREAAERHLRALVGRDDAVLREDQWAAIEALAVDRRRALVVQRTGWGKSAVYFVATLLLRERAPARRSSSSPLLALMRNQIAAAERAGIRAVTINSTNIDQWQPIHDQIHAGEVDVLLVSPERLNNPGFRDEVLPRLAATCGLLVVDEAHCISDWGHDFRPDYRRLRTLLAELPTGIPVLATTATANARVTADVAEQLGGRPTGSRRRWVLVQRGTLDRESLRLGVVRLKTPEQRLAWLADHLAEQPGSGIVYCLTVAATQEVAGYLRDRGPRGRRLLRPDRARRAPGPGAGPGRRPGQGADRHQRPRHGLRRRLGFVINLGAPAVARRLLPAGRPRRPRHAPSGATVVLLPADRGPRHLGLLRLARLPAARSRCARPWRALAESDRPLSTADPGDPRRARPQPARVDAQGARRRRRRPAGAGRLGRDRRSRGPTTPSATPASRGARARAAGDARPTSHHRVPDALPPRAARRPGREPTAAAATTAAG